MTLQDTKKELDAIIERINIAVEEGKWDPDGRQMASEYTQLKSTYVAQQRKEDGLEDGEYWGRRHDGSRFKIITVPMNIWNDAPSASYHRNPERCRVCGKWIPMGETPFEGIGPIAMINLSDGIRKKCPSCAYKFFAESIRDIDLDEPVGSVPSKDIVSDGKFRPLGIRGGPGTFDTFFDTKKYSTWKEAFDANDAVIVDFIKEDGVIKFEAHHSSDPSKKLFHTLIYQHFPAGIDVYDDQAAIALAEQLYK